MAAQNGADIKDRPLVSVIIPTHNRARLLRDAIASVCAQEGSGQVFDMEIIVVDDASSDQTPEVIRQFPEICSIRLPTNGGASAARNAGLKVAKGKYVAFLDDDDLFLPHKLKSHVPILESRKDIGVVYGQISISGEAACDAWPESAPSGDVFGELLVRTDDFMSPDAILVRREAFDQAGGFDESLPTMEHYDMYVRLAFHVPFLFVPGVVAHGRYSKAGKWHTNVKNRNNERVLPRIIERALAMLPSDRSSESLRRRARTAVFSTVIRQRWATKDVQQVREYLLTTLGQHPWMVSEPVCIAALEGIARQLAITSSDPNKAVRGFWKEVRAMAPVRSSWGRLKRNRLVAGSAWRGASRGLWAARSYPSALYGAGKAALWDPVEFGRAMIFKIGRLSWFRSQQPN